MQYSQEHLKTMVYAEFWGGQTQCIMGNWKIENKAASRYKITSDSEPTTRDLHCG